MIWCVEDDKGILDIELYTLKSTGFESVGFSNGRDFFEALEKSRPDLIILDIMLPDIDGVEILKKLRATPATEKIPVIMATAKGMEYDKIQSLDSGADDYLVKPFGMMEMVSRIRAVLRRCSHLGGEHIKYGGIDVNLERRTVFVDGVRTELTYKEFELLTLFLHNIGTVFSRDSLFRQVWGEEFVGETRTIDVHIRTLRQKLGKYGAKLVTVRNVGYRMEAEDE